MSLFKFPKDYHLYKERCNLNKEQKSFCRQMAEVVLWGFLYGEYFDYYFLSGANFKRNSIRNYIGGSHFRKVRDEKNYKNLNKDKGFSDIILLRDKLVFEKWMTYHQIPTVTSLGKKYGRDIKTDQLNFNKKYFVKVIDGQQGRDIHYIENERDLLDIDDNNLYIIQEELNQHPFINNIYPESINTVRVITIRNKGKIEVFSALHRFGTVHSGKVDNWSAGGIIVPIEVSTGKYDRFGILSKEAVLANETNIYHESHPDTGKSWKGKTVPMWEKIKETACRAHATLPTVVSVGWDIVVGPDGVLVLEGNDNWGISTVQSSMQGVKKELLKKFERI